MPTQIEDVKRNADSYVWLGDSDSERPGVYILIDDCFQVIFFRFLFADDQASRSQVGEVMVQIEFIVQCDLQVMLSVRIVLSANHPKRNKLTNHN